MTCRGCGNPIPSRYLQLDAFKCPNCGRAYRRSKAATEQSRSSLHSMKSQDMSHAVRSSRNIKKKKSYKKYGIIVVLVLLVIIVAFGNNADDENLISADAPNTSEEIFNKNESDTVQSNPVDEVDITEEPDERPTYSTNVTVAEFIERFRLGMEYLGDSVSLVDTGADEEGMGNIEVDDYIGLSYSLANNDRIALLTFVGSGDGTEQSGLHVMRAIASALYGFDSSLESTDTGEIIMSIINGETYDGGTFTANGGAYQGIGTVVMFMGK